ncbi:MAG: hypothetical protein ACE5EY_02845 [Anaerolineae bacterium]
MKRLITLILLGLTALLLAACSGGQSATPDAAGKLVIDMIDFRFLTDDIQLKVGQEVTIILDNHGEKDHELMIGRNALVEGSTTIGFEHDMFAGVQPMVMGGGSAMDHAAEGDGGMEGMGDAGAMDHAAEGDGGDMGDMGGMEMDHAGFMVLIPFGSEQATLTFTVTEDMVGEWEMACFQGNGSHYDDGMRGKVVVTP